ncbi:hypothetical protein [Actinokineospora pegani]|uniref:hypothetical protein n=1 Tax=Actinokineospora pegani TaxID=2654637 RepID=UPI0012EA3A47|nr:hypothetical protein [Actinokineospora pegani]
MPDLAQGWEDPELRAAALAAGEGDPGPAIDLVTATRGDWDRRDLVIGFIGDHVLPVYEKIPDVPETALLRPAACATAGWGSRGPGRGATVTRLGVEAAADFMAAADEFIMEAAEFDPDDPVPWSLLLACVLPFAADDEQPASAFIEVVRRAPLLYSARLNRLQSLAPKWFGTREQMLGFAHATAADLPDGHPLHALVALAHLESYLETLTEGGFFKRLRRGTGYLRDESVRAEVDAASDRLLATPPFGGGRHPRSGSAHQVFAAFYLELAEGFACSAPARSRLARHMALAGAGPDELPWAYFGDPVDRFHKARSIRG